jgi:hypothetical protein
MAPGTSHDCAQSARWLALDVLRATAVLLMIQGHTFTALLEPALLEGAWVQGYTLLHGLTAPMFLIGGGLAYGLVALGDGSAPAGARRRRLQRGLSLLAIGVSLQLPAASFGEILARADMRAQVLRCGALQLVGTCLLCCELLRALSRSRRAFGWALGALTVALAVGAPFVWNARLSDQFALGSWLDGYAGSLFPLAPWAVFFFLGVLAWLAGRRRFAAWAGFGGLALAGSCYAAYARGFTLHALYGEHEFWHSNPLFVGFRAGWVFAWLGLLTGAERAIAWLWRALPALGQGCRLLARRALVAYVAHLLLLYGTPFTTGLARRGARFDVAETLGALAYVFAVTVALVLVWDRYVATGPLSSRLHAWRLKRAAQRA